MRADPEDDRASRCTRMAPRALMAPPGVPDFFTRVRTLRAGPTALEGRAWSGRAAIERVEVSTDGGATWADAELGPPELGRWAWRGWTFEWQAEPGEHVALLPGDRRRRERAAGRAAVERRRLREQRGPARRRRSRSLALERFDAIVVGAGPGGSVTAYRLARAGVRVLLLDRARFPRDKPCGGGITLRARNQLPIDPAPVVEDVVDTFELGLRYGRRIERRGKGPLVLMTQRRRLDHHLANAAAAAGADFRDAAKVTAVEADGDGVTVRLDGTAVRADALVGADGANGITARSLGLGRNIDHGVALEGNVGYGDVSEERYRGRAVVELGTVPGGYTWVFPKGDHANVGAGGWGRAGPRLREYLDAMCARYGVPRRPPHRRARPPAADAPAGVAARARAGRCSWATRPGSSIRSPATVCTRRS